MRTLIETFVTVFLASITVLICAEFIGIQLQTNNAKDLHTTYVSMIESSDFDTATIDQCKTDAQDKGYELEVDNSSTPKKKCSNCNTTMPAATATCPSCGSEKIFEYYNDLVCTVKLKYKISVPVIGLEREGVVNGYAR